LNFGPVLPETGELWPTFLAFLESLWAGLQAYQIS